MRWYRDFLPGAPEDVNGFFAFMRVPSEAPFPEELHDRPVAAVIWCCLAEPERAAELIAGRRNAPQPLFEHLGPMPYPALQSAFDRFYPPGDQWYWRGDFVRELSDEAIAKHVAHGSAVPTPQSSMHLYPVDGAVHRVAPEDTAFHFRSARFSQVIVGVDPDPQQADTITRWCKDYWSDLHPYSEGGAYVNFLMHEGEDRVRATYGANYERLVQVKSKYDPDNLFRFNQNIVPSH